MEKEAIKGFFGANRFLSNFYPANIILEGLLYSSVEHAYQAAKTLVPEEKIRIQSAPTPSEAKKLGKVISIRPDWDSVKLAYMKYLVWIKFLNNAELRYRLLQTNGSELIEENHWNDTFWGVCKGIGQNQLGKILMEVRDLLSRQVPPPNAVDNVFTPGEKEIFVFGSNLAGVHGAGAARTAYLEYGAEWGKGEGLSRLTYAIPTKDQSLNTLSLERIREYVNNFLVFASTRRDLNFFVTRIGCGLAGYSDGDIAPMFRQAPNNCLLPPRWRNHV